MYNKFCKKQLWECSADLSAVAFGKIPAETVIKNAKLINVCTKEIMENTDVAIHSGRIALVGDASHCIGENTKVILLGDPDQIDSRYLDRRNNGLVFTAEKMKGSPLCAQITFEQEESVRSPLAMEAAKRMTV